MIESPCIKICKVDSNGICVGCYRSVEEISNWFKSTDAERQGIMESVAERKATAKPKHWWSHDN